MAADDTLATSERSTLTLSACKMMPLARLLAKVHPDTTATDGVADRGSRMSPGRGDTGALAATQRVRGGEATSPMTDTMCELRRVESVSGRRRATRSPTRKTGLCVWGEWEMTDLYWDRHSSV